MQNNFVKITKVTYRVLDFLPDGDPLKNKAKEKALALLENFTLIADSNGWVSLKKYLSTDREKTLAQIAQDITILEGYLEVGKNQGWINTVNFLIISKEYSKIGQWVSSERKSFKESLSVDLPSKKAKTEKVENIGEQTEILKPENKDLAGKDELHIEAETLGSGGVSQKALTRQVKILEILNRRGRAQVSDVIKELPDVTKRTIRRDMDDLLKSGKIERVGEWNQVFYRIFDRTK